MLRPSPLLRLPLRALFAALLLCGLVSQSLGLPALASIDGARAAAARCADFNPDASNSPVPDSPAPVHGSGDHCMLCAAQQAVFLFTTLIIARAATDAPPAPAPRDAPPPGCLARNGWGSSWSSQAPPDA